MIQVCDYQNSIILIIWMLYNIILRRYVMSYEYISDSHFYTFWEFDQLRAMRIKVAYIFGIIFTNISM